MAELCECKHPKNYHNEVGCGGVVELRTSAIVNHAACKCKSYRPPAEPDATERARAWVQKQTGRFELDNPLLEADIADLAAFLESETPRIKADAVREFTAEVEKEIIEHLEAENALLKKKLEIALRGLDEYGDEKNWSHVDGWPQAFDKALRGYELARRIKADIEEGTK